MPRSPLAAALACLVALAGGRASAADTASRLADALLGVRFVAYTPRGFDPGAGPPPSEAGMRADLALLRRHFSGLVTYSSANGLDALPRLAREAGFEAVILGVWNPSDPDELGRALAAARGEPRGVLALALGNEGLFFHRYDAAQLAAAFARARREAPGTPLALSEPFHLYLGARESLPAADLWLPTVHPIDQPWFGSAPPATSVEFVVNVVGELEKISRGVPILVKETGLPSGPSGDGFSESAQAAFWSALRARLPPSRQHGFVWFEAFDAPWKPARTLEAPPEKRAREAHFGLLRADGSAKPALAGVR